MKHAGVLGSLLLGALSACTAGDTWSSRVEESSTVAAHPEMQDPLLIFKYSIPSPPPDELLRKPADFRIFDAHLRKEFFLYLYEDEGIKEEVITVINYAVPEKQRRQQPATPDEAQYAMELFIADWRSKGQNERIQYFNRRNAEEQYRRQTQIDDMIVHTAEEKKWWDTQVLNLDSDLQSRKNTSTFAQGDEKRNLSDTQKTEVLLAQARRMQALAEAKLWILEYRRAIRDSQYSRAGTVFVERAFLVADLLPYYAGPEKLIEEIKIRVQPFAWSQPDVKIYIAEGKLVVHHTRDMAQRVQDYVIQLRAAWKASKQENQVVPAPPKQ